MSEGIVPRVAMRGISKRYGGVRAIRHADFTLEPGTVHALVGENGAGKSTLIKILAGAEQTDTGSIEFDGKPVQHAKAFRLLVAGTEVGRTVKLKVFRTGKYRDLKITLGEYDERTLAQAESEHPTWLGLAVEDVSSRAVREKFALDGEERGVVVTQVDPNSAASKKGLAPGALILEIVNQEIGGLADYNRIREELKDRSKPITFKVKDGGTVRYVALSPAP